MDHILGFPESGGWKCAIVGVPWRGSVSACLAWGDLLVNNMCRKVLKRLSLLRHHGTPAMARPQLPDQSSRPPRGSAGPRRAGPARIGPGPPRAVSVPLRLSLSLSLVKSLCPSLCLRGKLPWNEGTLQKRSPWKILAGKSLVGKPAAWAQSPRWEWGMRAR